MAERILLVDDDPDIRAVAEIGLADVGGFTVAVADSGVAALDMVSASKPDVIILDVMMPGLDGPATLGRLRGQPDTATIPVIFLTARVQKHEVASYLSLGAVGVIEKPFDPMTLAAEVRALLAAAASTQH